MRHYKTKVDFCISAVFGFLYTVFVYLPSWFVVMLLGGKLRDRGCWIVSERPQEARDNGYHIFKYLCENCPDVSALYAIKGESDAEKVRDLGKTVQFGSYRHCIAFISAECILSTGFDMGYPNNLCGVWIRRCFRFLRPKGKIVFLDHGIIKDKMPSVYKNKTDCDLFICGADPEFSFISKGFGYKYHEVQYTGHARYDGLNNPTQGGYILFMPTWRMWLDGTIFTETEYFFRCQELLKCERLQAGLKKNKVKLYFYLHPKAQKYRLYFSTNCQNVEIVDANACDLQALLTGANAFITDYSSTFFDVAYMRKPIVFYHYDYDQFRAEQYPEGYFDYREDGFGPVVQTHDQVVDELEWIMENSFQMSFKYASRVDRFFTYQDDQNCERIYLAIRNLLEGNGQRL